MDNRNNHSDTSTSIKKLVSLFYEGSPLILQECTTSSFGASMAKRGAKKRTNEGTPVVDSVSALLSNISITLRKRGLHDWKVRYRASSLMLEDMHVSLYVLVAPSWHVSLLRS